MSSGPCGLDGAWPCAKPAQPKPASSARITPLRTPPMLRRRSIAVSVSSPSPTLTLLFTRLNLRSICKDHQTSRSPFLFLLYVFALIFLSGRPCSSHCSSATPPPWHASHLVGAPRYKRTCRPSTGTNWSWHIAHATSSCAPSNGNWVVW